MPLNELPCAVALSCAKRDFMNRRDMLKLSSLAAAAASAPAVAEAAATPANISSQVPRWDYLEINLAGPTSGNPFLDVTLAATFHHQNRSITVAGFYDGDGSYKIRFMPD